MVRRFAKKLVFDVEDNVMLGFGPVANDHPNPLLRFVRGAGKYRYLIRRGRSRHHQFAVAQRFVPRHQLQARLHLYFLVDRFRPLRAS